MRAILNLQRISQNDATELEPMGSLTSTCCGSNSTASTAC